MVKPFRPISTAVALAFACALLPAAVPAATRAVTADPGYPWLGIYGQIHGDGTPFFHAPTDSTLDPTVLDAYARFDMIVLDASPITPYRPDIIAALRSRNPGVRVLAYVTGNNIWNANDPDSLHHYPTIYRHMIRDLNGFLYNSVDGSEFPYCDVNIAKRDSTGRFVVAEAVADLFANTVLGPGTFDGLFIDEYCEDPSWMQDATHQFDYVRAGYSSLTSFLAAWKAGSDTLADRLRRDAGATVRITGNCGTSDHQAVFNGWMREDFPAQGGGTWFSNMLNDPHGYLADDRDYVQPPQNFISSWMVGLNGEEYSSTNTRKARFGLGSAALGQGYAVYVPSSDDNNVYPYYNWWYDEYAVDVASGQSMAGMPYTHWLGQPVGGPYQMIWVGTNPDAVSNPDFETDVTSGWSFGRFSPAVATIERDTTTAAVHRASAHVTITTTGVYPWDVNFTTTGSIPMYPGTRYSATFWARASSPRVLPVVATLPTGGQVASQNVNLDTTWRQYQVVLQPTQISNPVLEFFLGQQAGEVWFDDVHMQQGETNIWRRDFDNGSVLVNPGAATLQVPLGTTYRHILGVHDTVVNDGSSTTTATVQPSDALFLIGPPRDVTPPNAIRDASVKP